MAGAFRTALPGIERAKACRRKAAVLQAPRLMDDPHRCSLVRAAHAEEIAGRIAMECPDLAASDTTS